MSIFDGECDETIYQWFAFKGYKNRKTRSIRDGIELLWREAIVCPDDPKWPKDRCGLGFFVDDDSHGFALYLKK